MTKFNTSEGRAVFHKAIRYHTKQWTETAEDNPYTVSFAYWLPKFFAFVLGGAGTLILGILDSLKLAEDDHQTSTSANTNTSTSDPISARPCSSLWLLSYLPE